MSRNYYDALCLDPGCRREIRVLIGNPQFCEQCLRKMLDLTESEPDDTPYPPDSEPE